MNAKVSEIMGIIVNNKRNICLAGCVLMAIAVFFTFMSVKAFGSSDSKSFIEIGDGWIVLIAAIAAAALIWFKKEKLSLGGTGVALCTTIADMARVGDKLSQISGSGFMDAEFGASPWLIILGAVLAAGPLVIAMILEKKAAQQGN